MSEKIIIVTVLLAMIVLGSHGIANIFLWLFSKFISFAVGQCVSLVVFLGLVVGAIGTLLYLVDQKIN